MKEFRDEHLKYRKLAEKIWHYLNGRYEEYDREIEKVSRIIHLYLKGGSNG